MKTASEQWFEKLQDIWKRQQPDEVATLMADTFTYLKRPSERRSRSCRNSSRSGAKWNSKKFWN